MNDTLTLLAGAAAALLVAAQPALAAPHADVEPLLSEDLKKQDAPVLTPVKGASK